MARRRKSNRNGLAKPLHIIRSKSVPTVAAKVFRRTSPDGFGELYFTLGRFFKEEQAFSEKFVPRHRPAIEEVIEMATDWIRDNADAADGARSQEDHRETN